MKQYSTKAEIRRIRSVLPDVRNVQNDVQWIRVFRERTKIVDGNVCDLYIAKRAHDIMLDRIQEFDFDNNAPNGPERFKTVGNQVIVIDKGEYVVAMCTDAMFAQTVADALNKAGV